MKADETVKKTIDEHCLINSGDILVLGLSGGPDSLCLLHILKGLEEKYAFSLRAFHLNHMIREDADDDEAFVKEVCRDLGVELSCVKLPIEDIARERGESVEAAGRIERHKALKDICDKLQKDLPDGCTARPVLAHNAGDQAETVLLRILRGTGIHGLSAMEYMREDGLIRPLLDTEREDIEEYCKAHFLSPRIDSTNASEEYLRNKVRLKVLPMLEEINPSVKNALRRLANSAAMDDGYLSEEAKKWYEAHEKYDKDGSPILRIKDLRLLEDPIFYRAIRIAFAKAGLETDIEAVHIKALKRSVYTNAGNKTVEFPGGYIAYINHGDVVFRKR